MILPKSSLMVRIEKCILHSLHYSILLSNPQKIIIATIQEDYCAYKQFIYLSLHDYRTGFNVRTRNE